MAGILTNSKEGVKTALREAIMKAMTDQDFEDNSDYQKQMKKIEQMVLQTIVLRNGLKLYQKNNN